MSDEFEAHIREIARELAYPPTPDLRLPSRPRAVPRLLRYTLLLTLVIGLTGLSVPGIRAAVLEFFRIGVVTIYLDGRSADGEPLALGQVTGETTLADVQAQVDFTLLSLPDDPPDRVFLQDGELVIFVWTADDRIERALYQIPGGHWRIIKSAIESVVPTQVRGETAYWVSMQHPVQFVRAGVEQHELTHFVAGRVLGWEQDGITYRLETYLPLDDARALAETLIPLP